MTLVIGYGKKSASEINPNAGSGLVPRNRLGMGMCAATRFIRPLIGWLGKSHLGQYQQECKYSTHATTLLAAIQTILCWGLWFQTISIWSKKGVLYMTKTIQLVRSTLTQN